MKNELDPRSSFSQREGVTAIPEQLKPGELSAQLRAMLWAPIFRDFRAQVSSQKIWHHWREILFDYHAEVHFKMPDTFSSYAGEHEEVLQRTFEKGKYTEVLDLAEWLVRHPKFPKAVTAAMERALIVARSPYRLVDNSSIISIAGGHEADTFSKALAATKGDEFAGSRTHLKNAAQELRNGRSAESMRESIHAVEATVTVLEPDASGFAAALSKLEARFKLHGAMKAGFANLYGFTSDEKGIRHSLGGVAEASVDEADAIYMFGACASFVTFLISKSHMK